MLPAPTPEMPDPDSSAPLPADGSGARSARFATTRWSMVVAAGRGEGGSGRESLARLCQAYWFPLYAYARRRGHSPEDSQDLTQAFFTRLMEKNWVAGADRSKGRFRTFLLAAMKHFLADEWDRAQAGKRGGGAVVLPLSFDTATFAPAIRSMASSSRVSPARSSTPGASSAISPVTGLSLAEPSNATFMPRDIMIPASAA